MKFLTKVTVTAALLVAALSATGSLLMADRLLGEAREHVISALADSAERMASGLGWAVRVDRQLDSLYQTAMTSVTAQGQLQPRDALREMRAIHPNAKVGRPLDKGGVSASFPRGRGIVLCKKTSRSFRCLAARTPGGLRAFATGETLTKAQGDARAKARL